jgi:predicted Zn-dependent protease
MAMNSIKPLVIAVVRSTSIALAFSLISTTASAQFPDLLKGLGGLGGAKPAAPKPEAAPAKSEGGGASGLGGLLGIVGGSQDTGEEIRVGEGVAGTVLGAAKLWNNPKAQKYVNLVGRYIAQQGERKDLPWAFAIVETSSINAFAAPGGIILITSGLYSLLETEDELAAVLAHEISHVNRQHHYNVIKQQKMVEFGSNLVQKELAQDKSNAMAQRLVGMGAELIARGLDKEAEFEADRDGMVLAARSGYDASAILVVLEKLQRRLAADGAVQLMFKTHPAPIDRIQRLTDATTPALEAAAVSSPANRRMDADGR